VVEVQELNLLVLLLLVDQETHQAHLLVKVIMVELDHQMTQLGLQGVVEVVLVALVVTHHNFKEVMAELEQLLQ